MNRKKMMLSTLAVGAAYLLRNKDTRQKLMEQFQSFTGPSKTRKEKSEAPS